MTIQEFLQKDNLLPREVKEEAIRLKGIPVSEDFEWFLKLYGDINHIDSVGNNWLFCPCWFVVNKYGTFAIWPKNVPQALYESYTNHKKRDLFWNRHPKLSKLFRRKNEKVEKIKDFIRRVEEFNFSVHKQ